MTFPSGSEVALVDVHDRAVDSRPGTVGEAETLVQAPGGGVGFVDADVHGVGAPASGFLERCHHQGPADAPAPPRGNDVELGQMALEARAPQGGTEPEDSQPVETGGSGHEDERVPAGQELPKPGRQLGRGGRGLSEFPVEVAQQMVDGTHLLDISRSDGVGNGVGHPEDSSGGAPRASSAQGRAGGTERGSITAFALLLVVALFALAGLVVDGGAAVSAHQAALAEAGQAARAGAGALSVADLRAGRVEVDDQAAMQAVAAFTAAAGHPGTATVVGDSVTVSVSYRIPTSVLGMIRITSLPVSATASATDVEGIEGPVAGGGT